MCVLCPSSSTTKLRGCSAEPPNPGKPPQIQEKTPSRALSLENAGQPLLALEMGSVLRCRGRSAGGRCWGDGFRWLPVGRAGSFSSSLSSPFNGQSKFLAFCILQGFVCLFVFLFFCKLKLVKTKLLLMQNSQEPGPSPAVDLSIFMYYEHYLGQELCSRLWNDELCKSFCISTHVTTPALAGLEPLLRKCEHPRALGSTMNS